MSTWRLSVKADMRYKRFVHKFQTEWDNHFNVKQRSDEIMSLHTGRAVRGLKLSSDKFLERVIEASLHDSSIRSRLCQIKLEINDISSRMQEHNEVILKYLSSAFNDELIEAGYRSKEAKISALSSVGVFPKVSHMLSDLEIVWANSDIVIDDIDKSGFSLKRVLDAKAIHDQRDIKL